MKLEIEYNGSVVGSLSAGQTVIIPKEMEFKTDIVIRAVEEEQEETSYILNGKYIFNDTLTDYPNSGVTLDISFGSSGFLYGYMELAVGFNPAWGEDTDYIYYISDTDVALVYNSGWVSSSHQIVAFDNVVVSKEFYDWFIANTTKHTGNSPMPV